MHSFPLINGNFAALNIFPKRHAQRISTRRANVPAEMGCAASTQDDGIVPSTHRRGRPANTLPDARLPVPTVRLGNANDDGSVATPRIHLGSDGLHAGGGGGRSGGEADGGGSDAANNTVMSPSQIRLNSKKQLSPINGKQVCTLALVDALPRYVAPTCTANQSAATGGASGSSPASHGLSSGGRCDGSTLGSAGMSPRRSHDGGPSPMKSPCRSRDCSICLMPLGGCSVVVMACLHSFHYDCAKEWLSQHDGSCPDCRTVVCIENFMYPSEVEGDAEVALRVHQEQQQQGEVEDSAEGQVGAGSNAQEAGALRAEASAAAAAAAAVSPAVAADFSIPPPMMPRQLWEHAEASSEGAVDESDLATLVVATDSLALARTETEALLRQQGPPLGLVAIQA